MKRYPKIHEDIITKWSRHENKIGSVDGSIEELTLMFREFYKKSYLEVFNQIVRQVWLEQQVTISGRRRTRRQGNGIFDDISFGKFMKFSVGISQRGLTATSLFSPIATYLKDFFPDFLNNNPFTEPEKYQYPYKNLTLDSLFFVFEMEDRLEILEEADKKEMLSAEFINWITNHALCYNLENNVEKYQIGTNSWKWNHVINKDKAKTWWGEKFLFEKSIWKK